MSLRQLEPALALVVARVVPCGWLVLVILSAPVLIICVTVIVLVMVTERSTRTDAVKALAPVLTALASQFARHRRDSK